MVILIRILHIAYIYPPKPTVADGITTVVQSVTKELANRGHDVVVYASNMLDLHGNNSINSFHSIINGVNVYYFKPVLRSKTFLVTPSMFSLLSKDLGAFDIIHIHDCRSFQGILACWFARLKRVPYVFQPHGSYLNAAHQSTTKTIAKTAVDMSVCNQIVYRASKIITLNETEDIRYRQFGVHDKKITIIPNGIDLSEYSVKSSGAFRKKFNIGKDKQIILYLGRIHKTKGIDILIKAFAHLVKTHNYNEALLVVAGPDDGYLIEAKSLARSLGVSDSVLFTGYVSREYKFKALVDANVFVSPSFSGFPLTFLEACATGTPIVTTNMGDTLGWIDNNVGYVTPPDHQKLSKAIHALLSNPELYRVFSNNCLNVVRNEFSLEKVVDKVEQTYKAVVDENALLF
jgi:glycosyltransferase involved in cell wall biosynthesis